MDSAKGLVAKLTPPHAQNACGFRGEMIWTVGLAACCNYFSKKKKKKHGFMLRVSLEIEIICWCK